MDPTPSPEDAECGVVSPPTRGWTHLRAPMPRYTGFPRPRGDGPDRHGRREPCPIGFPAHAGMDRLQRAHRAAACGGFPRPRGDGPMMSTGIVIGAWPRFPRPRGDGPYSEWLGMANTTSEHRDVSAGGFPAHAGMDPHGGRAMLAMEAVSPPTRGWTLASDDCHACRARSKVSPPTRGWTSHCARSSRG